MKERVSIYKNAWKIYIANFAKLFSFTFSIVIIFLLAVAAELIVSYFDFGITGIILCAFVLIPLFFSYQIVIAKVSSGKEITYNELYATYKAYYLPHNKGVYSVIKNTFLTIIVGIILIWLSAVLYDFIYPDLIETAVEGLSVSLDSISFYEEVINAVLGLDNYIYFLTCFIALIPIFFFSRIRKNFMIPYFNLVITVPSMISHQINKKLYDKERKYITSTSFLGGLLFSIAFIVGFIATIVIIINFFPQIELIDCLFVFGMGGGLMLSSILLPPFMIVQCFMADHLHHKYMDYVKE